MNNKNDSNNEALSANSYSAWIDDEEWAKADHSVFNEKARVSFNLKNIGRSGQYLQTHNYFELLKNCMRKIDLDPDSNILELGAGVGAFSTVLSKMLRKSKIFSLEYSRGLVTEVMPEVFKHMRVRGDNIERIHGSFDDLKLQDESIDLVIANCSFHHADDLKKVCSESYRVLREGKYLVLFERVHPENISDDEIQKMLSKVKSPQRMHDQFGVSQDTPITRKMLGEHEYRASDWLRYLFNAGFSLKYFDANPNTKYCNKYIDKLRRKVRSNVVLRRVCLRIPYIKKYFYQYRNLSLIICQKSP